MSQISVVEGDYPQVIGRLGGVADELDAVGPVPTPGSAMPGGSCASMLTFTVQRLTGRIQTATRALREVVEQAQTAHANFATLEDENQRALDRLGPAHGGGM